jgi:hypothetical protein
MDGLASAPLRLAKIRVLTMNFKLLILIAVIAGLTGCKDAEQAQFAGLSKPHIVKQYSGGVLVGEWESTGSISNETNSDGWYFEDAKTRNLVKVTGDIQITIK